jgi:alkyl hydroperoxide reductase subunit AhpC
LDLLIILDFHFSISRFDRLSIPHKAGGIRGVQIPLIADKSMAVTKQYGVLNEEEGIAYRFVFSIYI